MVSARQVHVALYKQMPRVHRTWLSDQRPPDAAPPPPLNYLARDYASFRQLMLDRLALSVPGWAERNRTTPFCLSQMRPFSDARRPSRNGSDAPFHCP